jgi:hypothetical protein
MSDLGSLRIDILWLLAERLGEPRLTQGEDAHFWVFVDSRHIFNQDLILPGFHKLRKVRCVTCGQEWVHA